VTDAGQMSFAGRSPDRANHRLGPTRKRWETAANDRALRSLLPRVIMETHVDHLPRRATGPKETA